MKQGGTINKTKKKGHYKIRNWHDYNQALIKRGSLDIWLSNDALVSWNAERKQGSVGAPQLYSDAAIIAMLTIHAVFNENKK